MCAGGGDIGIDVGGIGGEIGAGVGAGAGVGEGVGGGGSIGGGGGGSIGGGGGGSVGGDIGSGVGAGAGVGSGGGGGGGSVGGSVGSGVGAGVGVGEFGGGFGGGGEFGGFGGGGSIGSGFGEGVGAGAGIGTGVGTGFGGEFGSGFFGEGLGGGAGLGVGNLDFLAGTAPGNAGGFNVAGGVAGPAVGGLSPGGAASAGIGLNPAFTGVTEAASLGGFDALAEGILPSSSGFGGNAVGSEGQFANESAGHFGGGEGDYNPPDTAVQGPPGQAPDTRGIVLHGGGPGQGDLLSDLGSAVRGSGLGTGTGGFEGFPGTNLDGLVQPPGSGGSGSGGGGGEVIDATKAGIRFQGDDAALAHANDAAQAADATVRLNEIYGVPDNARASDIMTAQNLAAERPDLYATGSAVGDNAGGKNFSYLGPVTFDEFGQGYDATGAPTANPQELRIAPDPNAGLPGGPGGPASGKQGLGGIYGDLQPNVGQDVPAFKNPENPLGQQFDDHARTYDDFNTFKTSLGAPAEPAAQTEFRGNAVGSSGQFDDPSALLTQAFADLAANPPNIPDDPDPGPDVGADPGGPDTPGYKPWKFPGNTIGEQLPADFNPTPARTGVLSPSEAMAKFGEAFSSLPEGILPPPMPEAPPPKTFGDWTASDPADITKQAVAKFTAAGGTVTDINGVPTGQSPGFNGTDPYAPGGGSDNIGPQPNAGGELKPLQLLADRGGPEFHNDFMDANDAKPGAFTDRATSGAPDTSGDPADRGTVGGKPIGSVAPYPGGNPDSGLELRPPLDPKGSTIRDIPDDLYTPGRAEPPAPGPQAPPAKSNASIGGLSTDQMKQLLSGGNTYSLGGGLTPPVQNEIQNELTQARTSGGLAENIRLNDPSSYGYGGVRGQDGYNTFGSNEAGGFTLRGTAPSANNVVSQEFGSLGRNPMPNFGDYINPFTQATGGSGTFPDSFNARFGSSPPGSVTSESLFGSNAAQHDTAFLPAAGGPNEGDYFPPNTASVTPPPVPPFRGNEGDYVPPNTAEQGQPGGSTFGGKPLPNAAQSTIESNRAAAGTNYFGPPEGPWGPLPAQEQAGGGATFGDRFNAANGGTPFSERFPTPGEFAPRAPSAPSASFNPFGSTFAGNLEGLTADEFQQVFGRDMPESPPDLPPARPGPPTFSERFPFPGEFNPSEQPARPAPAPGGGTPPMVTPPQQAVPPAVQPGLPGPAAPPGGTQTAGVPDWFQQIFRNNPQLIEQLSRERMRRQMQAA